MLSFEVLAIQPGFIAWNIALRFDFLIMSLFLKLLCIVEVLLVNGHQLLKLKGKFFCDSGFWTRVKIFLVRNARMIFTVELKRCMASGSIFGIIVSKLDHRKKLYLIILFKVDKSLKVGFYYFILPFSLAIYLKIEAS